MVSVTVKTPAQTAQAAVGWHPWGGWAVHPGELLLKELVERDMTQAELAQRLGFSQKHLSMVINAHTGIGVALALALEHEWGVSAELWMIMQAQYDVHVARQAPSVAILGARRAPHPSTQEDQNEQ